MKIIVATHGNFADGIMDSLRMICGEQEKVICFCAYNDSTNEESGISISDEFISLLDSIPREEEIVVLVDLLGGSVCNEFIKLTERRPFHLVAGLNLGLLMEFVLTSEVINKDKITEIISGARSSIVYVNQLIENDTNDSIDVF